MKNLKKLLHLIIIVLFILELVSRWSGNHLLEYYTKPWLMAWIAIYFLIFSTRTDYRVVAVLAFFFSWVGDMFLMLAHTNELLFFAGVGGFFVAQLFYVYLFTFYSGSLSVKGFIRRYPLFSLPFIIYLAVILFILLPRMEGVMIPIIIIYAISLIGMSLAALNRRGKVNQRSFWLLFAGSLLFVASDSMIAINKFYAEFSRSSFLVMLTYFTAQYLIMQGLLADKK